MKEIMLPYVLVVWLLFKFKVLKPTARNYFISVFVGFILLLCLFFGHRFYSPADLTNSTTVKAPHSVLSPAFGQQIEQVYVDHNQIVKKGDVLYKLHDEKISSAIADLNAQKDETVAKITAQQVALAQAKRNYTRVSNMQELVSQQELEKNEDLVATVSADIQVLMAKLKGCDAQLINFKFELERLTVKAPFDGLITHVFIAEGSRIGALHVWNTNKKFVEMRIPDQAYANIRKGQFSEFYVDAFPGQIFRARVHSKVNATGEAQGNLFPQEQLVSNHVNQGAMPVGRTIILEVDDEVMAKLPIGATGSAWVSADKPYAILGFLDIIGGATVRLMAGESYIKSF